MRVFLNRRESENNGMITHEDKAKHVGWVQKGFFFALCMVGITLPLYAPLNSVSIILLGVFWIGEGAFREKIAKLLHNPVILIYSAFYLWFVLGMLYTQNEHTGQFNLEKKLSLLILPVLIGTSSSYHWDMRAPVLWSFVSGTILASLISIGGAVYNYIASGEGAYFLHDKLASTIGLQPPYFGMFLSFTIVIVMSHWRSVKDKWTPMQTSILFIGLLLLVCFIVLLSARTALIFLLLYGVASWLKVNSTKQRMWGVIIGVVVIVFLSVMISRSPYLYERFVRPVLADITITSGGGETGLSIRLVKWRCSLEGIREYPLLGVGTGDAEDYLVKCYERENFWGMYEQYRFNSHNQYLETGLTLGLIGFFLLTGTIAIPALAAQREKDELLMTFLALFAFSCLTESVLERQWGIVFYTFFVSLLSFSAKRNPANSYG